MRNLDLSNIAKSVISEEAEALLALGNTIGKLFNDVVLKINEINGRVILTGVGKSSHIAKKIASTFASTGTPAFFIHPTEASHGDLGMIQGNDILIALSRSGESSELRDVLIFCKQNDIPIIAITAVVDSTLAKLSDFILRLPEVDEACTLGLAPTTSSIMMLALGDSLAISCMEVKKFTKDNFKMFHPAGKLGLSLLKVGDVMHTGDKIPLVNLFSSLSDSIIEMTRCSFGCVGVTDESNRLIGIFTDGDLRRNLLSINLAKPITEFMAEQPYSLDADSFIVDSLKIFKNKRIPSAFVCDGSKPIGIVHIHDLIQRGLL